MTKQAIYISYYFPPIHSVASIRNAHLVEELRAYFEQIDVITTDNCSIFPEDEYPIDGISIHDIPTFDYRTLWFKRGKKNGSIHHSEAAKRKPLVSILIRLNETLPFNLFFGEGGMRFIYNAYRKASNIVANADRSAEITFFSSYRPTADIVIGYLIKRKFPAVRWVNNFHDAPFSFSDQPSLLQRIETNIWKRLLKKSTLNITVSKGVTMEIERLNPRSISIPNGVKITASRAINNSIFTIAYTGSLYGFRRDPKPLFEVLTEMIEGGLLTSSNFQLIYAGKDGATWDLFLQDYSALQKFNRNQGNISRAEVSQIQASAHINLLLTWSSLNEKGILTGKLYEYLGVRNPILAIVNGDDDEEIYEIFNRLSCGQALYTSDSELHSKTRSFIVKHLSLFNNQDYTQALNPISELKKMTWAGQVKQLMDTLD